MAKPRELLSAPVIISQPRELVVGAGSNISLSCSATGMGTLDIVWFQDQQNLNSTRQTNSALDFPTSTLLLERRYEIAMEFEPPNTAHSSLFLYNLKLNDTGLFICSVKNEAGTSYTNHSLIVNDSPPARLRDLATTDPSRHYWWWQTLSQNSDTQLGLVALIFVIILLAAVILLLILKNYTSRSGSTPSSSSSSFSNSNRKSGFFATILNLFNSNNQKQKKPPTLAESHHHRQHHRTTDEDANDDCSSSSSSTSSCRKNSNHTTTAHADLEGFIEHLRSGIINMDYHAMSPVVQFNNQNTNKNNYQQQSANKPLQQPPHYFAAIEQSDHHQMHHFPSASNTSSLPYYSQGSASMSTTLSNLSPTSANMQTAAYTSAHQHQNTNNGPSIINCDMQHRLNGIDQMAPPTNTTTTSYTSDYQSGYGDHQDQPIMPANSNMMIPPMYYETAPEPINYPSSNQLVGQSTSMLLNGAFPVPRVPTYLILQQQQHQQLQANQQQQLVGMHNDNRNTSAGQMHANMAARQDQDLSSSRPSLLGTR